MRRASSRRCLKTLQVLFSLSPAPRRRNRGPFSLGQWRKAGRSGSRKAGQEELRIKIQNKAIFIFGGRPRGTLYGVYEFFERYLGVRYLTFDHTYLPPSASGGSLPLVDFRYQPPFSYRCSYYAENYEHREFSSRLRVNIWTDADSLGGSTREHLISHTFYQQVPVDTYGTTHPEYFALVDGVRLVPTGRGAAGPQLDVSNPDVLDIVTDAVLRQLDADPTLENVSVSQNDNDQYCRCDSCEAINRREGTPMGAHLRFVNAVAERVAKKYPHVKVGTLAYYYTRKPPRTVIPRDNVQVQLATAECCILHEIDDADCPKNRAFFDDFTAWKNICKNLWIWTYATDFRYYDLPFPNLKSIGPNINLFRQGNVQGIFVQGNGSGLTGEMSDLRNYVVSRCLWDPTQDSWKLAKEFCKLHYGKAGPRILDYLTMIHENAETKRLHPTCLAQPAELGLDTAVTQRSMKYFKRAIALAENASVRSRVEKASIPAYRAMIESGMTMKYSAKKVVPDVPGGAAPLVEHYRKLSKRYGMSMADEETPFTSFEKKLEARLAGIPAARIENRTWRLTLVPGEDGKVVDLLHKPTGRSFLAGIKRGLAGGTLEEVGDQGFDQRQPSAFSVRSFANRVVLSKSLPDGSGFERTITLDSLSGKIFFTSSLTRREGAPQTYQVRVRAEFTMGTRQSDSTVVDIYTREQAWRKVAGTRESSREARLEGARTGVAFYNRRLKAGLGVLYDEEKFQSPLAREKASLREIDFEIPTRAFTLSRGESLTYTYTLEFLRAAPSN